jgi:hypothetical protein
MTDHRCPFEAAVSQAARSGDWNEELRAHRVECRTCAEQTLVVAALAADAEDLTNLESPLPDPGVIWFRAQLADREIRFERATRAIVWVQRATIAAAAAVGLFFAHGYWPTIKGFVGRLDLGSAAAELPRAADSPLLVLALSLLVLGGLALWELTAVHEN